MFVVALVLFMLAAVSVVTGVLGFTGTLPRNRFVGVHTDDALSTEETFRVANRVAAPTGFGAGLLLAVGGAIALTAGPLAGLAAAAVAMVIALFTLGAGVNAAEAAVAALVPVRESCGSSCGACSLRGACESAN